MALAAPFKQEKSTRAYAIGHSLAGLAIHLASGSPAATTLAGSGSWRLANLPDADFLPGYLISQPRAYHWDPHSLAPALLAAACSGFWARLTGEFARSSCSPAPPTPPTCCSILCSVRAGIPWACNCSGP
jgi:hypothetical protein